MSGTDTASLARDLATIVGGAHVLSGGDARRYALDAVVPPLAVRPGSLEELSAVARCLHGAGAAFVPWGGGTHAEIALAPRRYEAAVLLERLNQVVEYDPDDLTAGVGAGLPFRELQRLAARNNQRLALDAPGGGRATVGGVFATGRIGPRRASTGAPRDKVLGMTVVLADGTVARSGGRVVKNVSGYDLHRLYTGSLGTLAIIAQVHVRLAAQPEARRTLLYRFPTVREAGGLMGHVRDARLDPAAVELLDAAAARAADARGAGMPWRARVDESAWTVAVLFEGPAATVEDEQRTLLAATQGLKPVTLEGGFSEEFWNAVCELSAPAGSAPLPDGRMQALFRASVLPSDVPGLAERWQDALAADTGVPQLHAHAASGHVHVRVSAPGIEALLRGWEIIASDLAGVEGTGQMLDAPPALKQRAPLWVGASGPLSLMKSIKESLDPQGLLSPGRLPFELEPEEDA